jgi:hypothetical protein
MTEENGEAGINELEKLSFSRNSRVVPAALDYKASEFR